MGVESIPPPAVMSRKHQVLAYVKHHYVQTGESPTQGEIALALRLSKQRVQALVRALDREGLVKRTRGQRRGIMLAGGAHLISNNDALLQLQDAGWKVNLGRLELVAPLPISSLPSVPFLDHDPVGDQVGTVRDGRAVGG